MKPNRRFLDLTFWSAHILVAIAVYLSGELSEASSSNEDSYIWVVLVAMIFYVAYFFAIGSYAKKFGKSSIVWGGVAFLFSPLGCWISYIWSFFFKVKAENDL